MYSHTFPHLSERFFKGTTWPPVEAVLHLVDGDHVFGLLYREMYYRHLYASGKPTLINAIIDETAGTESGRITMLNPQTAKK